MGLTGKKFWRIFAQPPSIAATWNLAKTFLRGQAVQYVLDLQFIFGGATNIMTSFSR